MGDSFVSKLEPKRVSFMRRLTWRQNPKGSWVSDILDTTYPEQLVIWESRIPNVAEGERWIMSVSRRNEPVPGSNHQILGSFPSPDAAKEFARVMVGDPE